MQTIAFSEVRANLAEALGDLDVRGEPVVISRRGRAAAVLMSVTQYESLLSRSDGPAARLKAWHEQHAAELQALDGGADPFSDVRSRADDRPVTWVGDIAEPGTA